MSAERPDISEIPPPDLRGVVDDVTWLDTVDSTNSYLAALAPASQTRLAASWNQSRGRGRLGRVWQSLPGHTLALSLELGPELLPEDISESWSGAVVLGAGASLAEAISTHLGVPARLKWPNDVLIEGQKVAGLLAERPGPRRIILGMGINVWTPADQLPTDTSTSLALHGLSETSSWNLVLTDAVSRLISRLESWLEGVAPADLDAISTLMDTIGQTIRVSYPDGTSLEGVAVGLDEAGRLIVVDHRGDRHLVHSADIWHLR